jgi:hypothetical protein
MASEVCMRMIEGFAFFPLTYDEDGELENPDELDAMIARANAASKATDAIVIAHGFRNDANDATTLYAAFLKTFAANIARKEFKSLASRCFVVAGVYWPSKPFPETPSAETAGARALKAPSRGARKAPPRSMAGAKKQLEDFKKHDATPAQRKKLDKAIKLLPKLEGNLKAQDDFVELVLSLVKDSPADVTEGLQKVRRRSGSELLARLGGGAPSGTRGFGDFFGGIVGSVGQFLNLTTWYVMKDRSGTVGREGVAPAVRLLRKRCPDLRIHLVGHSLGGRLMASCAKALTENPVLRVDSLLLLEAAFSHFGFSEDNGRGTPGFFRDVVVKQVVKGPFVSTFSAQDTVVGGPYAIMSRLASDNTREIGDATDEFGGIGRNGPLRTVEVANFPFRKPGTAYDYKSGVINNLDGSGGFIKDHADVMNEAVTYALASAIAKT